MMMRNIESIIKRLQYRSVAAGNRSYNGRDGTGAVLSLAQDEYEIKSRMVVVVMVEVVVAVQL